MFDTDSGMCKAILTVGLVLGTGCAASKLDTVKTATDRYALHRQVTVTVFWVGEGSTSRSIANVQSAWDSHWEAHFGGVDDPDHRIGSRPARFVPRENPFYFALPYNDFAGGRRKPHAAATVPWAKERTWGAKESMCKNRWIRITHGGRNCYAQWEDVGPFRTDDCAYVFGSAAPLNQQNHAAGLDISPAVRDYLGLKGMDKADWQFVDARDVPAGPWKETITASQICWH